MLVSQENAVEGYMDSLSSLIQPKDSHGTQQRIRKESKKREESRQADQSQSFQASGQSSASNQLGGGRKGQKPKQPSGEGDGSEILTFCDECALTEIKNLLDQLGYLKLCHLCLHAGIEIGKEANTENKNDDLILPLKESSESGELDKFEELKVIREWIQGWKNENIYSGFLIPEQYALRLNQIRKELQSITPQNQVNELESLLLYKTLKEKLDAVFSPRLHSGSQQDRGYELIADTYNVVVDGGTTDLMCIDEHIAKLDSQEKMLLKRRKYMQKDLRKIGK